MSEIQVIDNFLEENQFDKIYNIINTEENRWMKTTILPNEIYAEDPKYNLQFVHPIYGMHKIYSDIFFELELILNSKLKYRQFVKIKANCVPSHSKIITHGLHVDIDQFDITGLKTAIFYLNTNNGYTIFEDGTKINSVENRMIVFPASMKHSGTTCTDTKERLVINFNYF